MITFLDENDVEYGALATIKATNAVNGERSLTGTIISGDYVLSNIERGWRLRFDDEYYVVTYAKPIDEGRDVQVTFDAVHQFFWDFNKSSVHSQLSDGSHTFVAYLDFIFKDSGYSYTVDSALNVYAFEKQSFGLKKRLTLFNDIITSTGVEFQVNGKVVRILEKVGTDLSTVVRKYFNMNELSIEKNIGDFVTYQKGFGAYFDENDHSKGRLEVEYTSPLASVYGKLEAEPLVDERYTQNSSMLAALKENVDNSYTISVSLNMEDLTRAGYKYTQPIAGDYIMAINETLDFQEKIRIVSFTSEYDVQGTLVKHEVTCNDIGTAKKLTASYNTTKRQASTASANATRAYSLANRALVSADEKNTNYYGNSFPQDNPKGTLKTGDLLFRTVGDTVKQYYWNGAEWLINPVVSDVEAFKEQIASELAGVPDREEFEATIAQELATSKAELETQIDTAKTQAETNAKAYADEINQATAEVAEQANTAANSLKSDLAKVQTDLIATTSTANDAKTSASEAKQQLTAVANDLSTAKQDLQAQASQLTAQASAQSEIKQTTDTISASVSALDSSTVKTASLTINTDGIVMKAGKSTTDVANAIGAYFAVNQNAINLFSDKINVKANMIVDGAITSTKIASKSINTAHLNGKIITADVIATGAITADAIKAGAVTTSAMTANSINGDRITVGTLDAAKIKAGSITASQIASGTITSDQIKAGGISAANIATGAITADKIAANAIDVSKITGDTANFVKAGFKSLYSNLDITGERFKFTGSVNNESFEISNTNYLLKLNYNGNYAGINPLSYGGISIDIGSAALFSIRCVRRTDNSENILLELDRSHARIGTQKSYINITDQKISIVKNNQVVQTY